MENRHKARKLAFIALYSWELNKFTKFSDIQSMENSKSDNDDNSIFANKIYSGVLSNIESIDLTISNNLANWDFERISKVDLAILRLSVYSLFYLQEISSAITINEAINLSKEFGADDSYKFINGILDSISKNVGVVLSK